MSRLLLVAFKKQRMFHTATSFNGDISGWNLQKVTITEVSIYKNATIKPNFLINRLCLMKQLRLTEIYVLC